MRAMGWGWAAYAVAGALAAGLPQPRAEVTAALLLAQLVPLAVVAGTRAAHGRALALRLAAAAALALAGALGASLVVGGSRPAAELGACAWVVAALAGIRRGQRRRPGAPPRPGDGVTWLVASVVGAAAAASAVSVAGTIPAAAYTLAGLLVAVAGRTPLRSAAERIDDSLADFRRIRRRRVGSLARTVRRRLAGGEADPGERAMAAAAEIEAAVAASPERAAAGRRALGELATALVDDGAAPDALVRVLTAERTLGGDAPLLDRLRRAGAPPAERAAAVRAYLAGPGPGQLEAAAREALGLLAGGAHGLRRAGEIVRRALHNRFKHGRMPAGDPTAPLTAAAARGLADDLAELGRRLAADPFAADRATLAAAGDAGRPAAAAGIEPVLVAFAALLWVDMAPALEAAAADLPGAGRVELDLAPEVLSLAAPLPLRTLRDAVDNLLWNAAEAARSSVRVRARVRAGELVIDVGDDGPGLDADTLARARARGGGLTIAARAAAELGGELGLVPASEGGGVRLRVPLKAPDER
jgi:histidine kinase/DNA gyrase B/HSP90-like ATPase